MTGRVGTALHTHTHNHSPHLSLSCHMPLHRQPTRATAPPVFPSTPLSSLCVQRPKLCFFLLGMDWWTQSELGAYTHRTGRVSSSPPSLPSLSTLWLSRPQLLYWLMTDSAKMKSLVVRPLLRHKFTHKYPLSFKILDLEKRRDLKWKQSGLSLWL